MGWRKTGIWIRAPCRASSCSSWANWSRSLVQQDFQMTLDEGGTKNYSESNRFNELARDHQRDGPRTSTRSWPSPESMLAKGTVRCPEPEAPVPRGPEDVLSELGPSGCAPSVPQCARVARDDGDGADDRRSAGRGHLQGGRETTSRRPSWSWWGRTAPWGRGRWWIPRMMGNPQKVRLRGEDLEARHAPGPALPALLLPFPGEVQPRHLSGDGYPQELFEPGPDQPAGRRGAPRGPDLHEQARCGTPALTYYQAELRHRRAHHDPAGRPQPELARPVPSPARRLRSASSSSS